MELIGLFLCSIIFLLMFGVGIFALLLKLGVIVQKASERPYTDMGNYTLDQGRDVGKDQ